MRGRYSGWGSVAIAEVWDDKISLTVFETLARDPVGDCDRISNELLR